MREQSNNPFRIDDQPLRVLYSDKSYATTLLSRPAKGRTLWVSNIPYEATSRELKALFAPYGSIRRMDLRAYLLALFLFLQLRFLAHSLEVGRSDHWFRAHTIRIPGGCWGGVAGGSLPSVCPARAHTLGTARQDRIGRPQSHPTPHARRRQAAHHRERDPPHVSSKPLPLGRCPALVDATARPPQNARACVRSRQHREDPDR